MILLYHKIDTENKTEWWVSADRFYRHLVQLSNKKVVYLDDYDPTNPDHVVITFDGVYSNVLRYAAPLLRQFGYPFELFVTGDTIGQGNEFDTVEPPCPFASRKELQQLVAMGGRLQWHTKTHRDITKLDDKEVEAEIIVPAQIKGLDPKGFRWFGYAYGKFDDRSQALVKKHYEGGGLACDTGTFDDKTIWPREIITEESQLSDKKVSVVIPCYNYAQFLVEAIESVLRQTYLPDEILLTDDASTDHTWEIMRAYERQYPHLIKTNRNKTNLGIEKHFNKAVRATKGDFVGLLGADNRYPSNYVENAIKTLLANDKTAIAYTDFALFGSRAEQMYQLFYKGYQGEKLDWGVFLIHFPPFTKRNREVLLNERNFIHGSSFYRRAAFDEVGGYLSREGTSDKSSEDYTLFQAMIRKGWSAEKVKGVYLEYRQHSVEQANQQFSYFSELAFLRKQFQLMEQLITDNKRLQEEYDTLSLTANRALEEIGAIKSSKVWRTGVRYRQAKKAVHHPVRALRYVKRRINRGPQA